MDAIVNLNGDELSRAYDNLSGELYASSRTAVLGNSKMVKITSQHLLEGAYFDATISSWVSTYGFSGQINGNDNAAAIHNSGHGVAFGFDMSPSENLLASVILRSGRMKIGNGQSRNSHTDVESYDIGSYLGAHIGALRLNGGVIYSHLNFDSERNIWIEGIKGKAKAHYHGSKIQAFGEASLPLQLGDRAIIAPYLNLSQTWLKVDSAVEDGTPAALEITGGRDKIFSSTLGMRGSSSLPTSMPLTLYGDVSWKRDWNAASPQSTHSLRDANSPFTIKGVDFARDVTQVGAGLSAKFNNNVSLDVGYQGRFGKNLQEHNATVQLKFKF